MKYLYCILRIFYCPHKYNKVIQSGIITENGIRVGIFYNKECCRCGKIKGFNITA